MSRTHKRRPFNLFSKESKMHRHPHYRRFRNASKRAVRAGEEAPVYRRTSGWLSW